MRVKVGVGVAVKDVKLQQAWLPAWHYSPVKK